MLYDLKTGKMTVLWCLLQARCLFHGLVSMKVSTGVVFAKVDFFDANRN